VLPARLLLFDIDNTLLYSGGAGSVAMTAAFSDLFGVDDGFGKIEFSGRTDRFILRSALDAHGIDGDFETQMAAFLDRYYALLPGSLADKQGTLMPGFPELLASLMEVPSARLGLATGNFSEAARLKLDYYGIEEFFAAGSNLLGGFGEESIDRADVVRKAIENVGAGVSADHVLVIGDTPKDITAALDNGVTAVGVATGSYTTDELRESGAHMVFEDFSDWRQAAATLTGRLS
jgi:phosphoglycolate phosphatase-like HAD superfamily hydrolase